MPLDELIFDMAERHTPLDERHGKLNRLGNEVYKLSWDVKDPIYAELLKSVSDILISCMNVEHLGNSKFMKLHIVKDATKILKLAQENRKDAELRQYKRKPRGS